MAETLRTLARVEALAGNTEGAAALRARARTLDGGRMLGLSEGTEGALEPVTPVTFTLMLEGAPAGARVRIDGRAEPAKESIPLQLAPGEHHLRIVLAGTSESLDGAALYGSFVVVGDAPGQSLRLHVGAPPPPCSTRDLEPALVATATDPTAKFAVTCQRWARVVRVADAAIEVRMCGATACGDKVGWAATPKTNGGGVGNPPGGERKSLWSSPWTYVAIGAAMVVTGGVAAWRLGAFDRGETPPPTWRWEGVGGR